MFLRHQSADSGIVSRRQLSQDRLIPFRNDQRKSEFSPGRFHDPLRRHRFRAGDCQISLPRFIRDKDRAACIRRYPDVKDPVQTFSGSG